MIRSPSAMPSEKEHHRFSREFYRSRARRRWPNGAKFWELVPTNVTADECWVWLGKHYERPKEFERYGGYGITSYGGRSQRAHRAMWLRVVGPIPKGLEVCHSCDTRACVNPKHLFLATHQENMLDCARKKRLYWYRPDARNNVGGSIKLNEEKVREIFRLSTEGKSGLEIAPLFGISHCAIYAVLSGRTWKWVPRPENFARPTRDEWRSGNSAKQRDAARRIAQVEHVCACGRKTKGVGHWAHVKACQKAAA